MTTTAVQFLHSPIAHGALGGALTAASIDFQAFRKWQSFHEFATYAWGTAIFRWCQGAAVGAVTATGLGALLG